MWETPLLRQLSGTGNSLGGGNNGWIEGAMATVSFVTAKTPYMNVAIAPSTAFWNNAEAAASP